MANIPASVHTLRISAPAIERKRTQSQKDYNEILKI